MSREGKLLIAHPRLPSDDWFHKTVIYIYKDSAKDGTLGLCLNMKTSMSLQGLCNDKGIIYPEGYSMIYRGGPVAPSSIIMLHSDEWYSSNSTPAGPGYTLSSDLQMFERLSLGDQPAYWRIFSGLCGWQPKQLDMELKGQFPYKPENSWLTCDANDHILFEYEGEKQWEKAVELSSQQMINSFF